LRDDVGNALEGEKTAAGGEERRPSARPRGVGQASLRDLKWLVAADDGSILISGPVRETDVVMTDLLEAETREEKDGQARAGTHLGAFAGGPAAPADIDSTKIAIVGIALFVFIELSPLMNNL
jgi:hypothetical protein